MIAFEGHSVADCGCRCEDYLVNGINTTVHFEDEEVDVFMDGGDWGWCEATLPAPSLWLGRIAALRWARERTSPE